MPATDETQAEAAEAARTARPHVVVMPDGTWQHCESYQEAWLHRNATAWAQDLNPLDVTIESEDGVVADLTLEQAVAREHPGATLLQLSGLRRTTPP